MKASHYPDVIATKLYELLGENLESYGSTSEVFDAVGVPEATRPVVESLLRNDDRFKFMSHEDLGLTTSGIEYAEEEMPESAEEFLLILKGLQGRLEHARPQFSSAERVSLCDQLERMAKQLRN